MTLLNLSICESCGWTALVARLTRPDLRSPCRSQISLYWMSSQRVELGCRAGSSAQPHSFSHFPPVLLFPTVYQLLHVLQLLSHYSDAVAMHLFPFLLQSLSLPWLVSFLSCIIKVFLQ